MSLDLSVLWVIFFVLLLVAVVNSLLFKPLLRVMHARERAVTSARELAEKATADAAAAVQHYEQRTQAARAELHRDMDDVRRAAEAQRAELLASSRKEADVQLAAARATVAQDAEAARMRLEAEAETLGRAIASQILGRPAS